MSRCLLTAMMALTLLHGIEGHGAVTKPLPRMLKAAPYCPWCVGEHNSGNPSGKVHLDAVPGTPCLGTSREGARYPGNNFGNYQSATGNGPTEYVAGQTFDSSIVLDADHAGRAQWSLCPHSETETEACFKKHILTPWTDVHAYWGGDSTIDHWKDGEIYHETVTLPNMPAGRATLRWLWVCKYTDELFASCIDVDITASGSAPSPTPTSSPTPAPVEPTPAPEPEPTSAPAPTPVGDDCAESWQQCGGKTWSGPTCCNQGLTCHSQNEYYAQCIPGAGSLGEISAAPAGRKKHGRAGASGFLATA